MLAGNAKKNDNPGGSKHVAPVMHTTKSVHLAYGLQEPFLLETATSNTVKGKTQGSGTQAPTSLVPMHVLMLSRLCKQNSVLPIKSGCLGVGDASSLHTDCRAAGTRHGKLWAVGLGGSKTTSNPCVQRGQETTQPILCPVWSLS